MSASKTQKRNIFGAGIFLAILTGWLCAGVTGCQSTRSSQVPSWWDRPHKHDAQHLYFTAEGISTRTYEDARQEAREMLRTKLTEYILSDMASTSPIGNGGPEFSLKELDASYGDEEGRIGRAYHVWLMGRYPVEEYNLIRDRLEKGKKLGEVWEKAQSAANRQQFSEAERLLQGIIQRYDSALRVSFDLEEVKLALASVYLKQGRGLKARQWIVDVQNSTQVSIWRIRANELFNQLPAISLKDAFEGKRIGIYACVRSNGETEFDLGLTQEIEVRLAKDGMRTSDCSKLKPPQRFDNKSVAQMARAIGAQKADVAFVILLDIDTSKTGAKVSIPGTAATTMAMDAKMTYFVVRLSDGLVMASDSTSGLSSAKAGMVNAILTHRRHLPNYAPVIAAGLGEL